MKYEVIEVHCQGCGKEIPTPNDCDWDLMRLGYYVHKRLDCQEFLRMRLYGDRCRRAETTHDCPRNHDYLPWPNSPAYHRDPDYHLVEKEVPTA